MKIEKQLQASQRAELFASEKIRRLSELLDAARETEIIARKENNILTSDIATLQTGIQSLTDDEIKKDMTVLYHELEQWVVKYCETHFLNQPEDGSARCKSQQVAAIQSEISMLILRNFWTVTFVGCGVQGDQCVAQMTEVIRNQCPNHVAQHWRYAMSIGAINLGRSNLQSQCHNITRWVGNIASLPFAERERQITQLDSLLGRCIALKHRIEYQEDSYIFWVSVSGVPFRGESMRDPLKGNPVDQVVECSLWPAIRKVLGPGNWEIIAREVVRTIPLEPPRVAIESQNSEWESSCSI
ncbi:unnamed protein product [Penicillium salamii]|uniref:Uncharacterized protein n=1 Tax=Penicillium salamii TaxID=1612424 RepID=A0A9W4N682_9EURO|nr:unnamed protein product [Penicillium salamii]